MRVIGVDPGLAITGFGVVETNKREVQLIEAGCIRMSATQPLEKRLLTLYQGFCEILEKNRPESVAVEALFSTYSHPKPAIQMGHGRGVILLAAAQHQLPVFSYEPTRVKLSLTGKGRASKNQVQQMIQGIFHLDKPPSPPDISDGLAIALCHLNALQSGTTTVVHGTRRMPEVLEQLLTTRSQSQPAAWLTKQTGSRKKI